MAVAIESNTEAAKAMAALKAEAAKGKVTFDLHVLVIMRQLGLNKGQASWLAWREGEAGLNARLNANAPITGA